jgi:hypothetical protein
MANELSHYSSASGVYPMSMEQLPVPSFKPKGLWVTVDGEFDWPTWCKQEEFHEADLQYKFRVALNPDANILYIQGEQELREFNSWAGETLVLAGGHEFPGYVNWNKVAEKYQGIVISPYVWSCRLDYDVHWYYGWDCASGCIWDADAIQEVYRIDEQMESACA